MVKLIPSRKFCIALLEKLSSILDMTVAGLIVAVFVNPELSAFMALAIPLLTFLSLLLTYGATYLKD